MKPPLPFLLLFLFLLLPQGPGVFAILARALTSGTNSCFSLAFGMTISDILYLVMATLGLATIAENWSGLFTIICLIGSAYLFYLGWKMWTAKIDPHIESNTKISISSSFWSGFIQGFLISASNPKVILFYIAFLPTFMDLSALNQNDIILASVLTLFALMLGLMLIAFSAASARKKFQSEQGVRYLNRTAGSIMMATGLFLVLRR